MQFFKIDCAEFVDTDDNTAYVFDTMQDRMVFGRRANGYTWRAANDTSNCRVITFGSTTRKHNLARLATNGIGNHIAGLVN